MPGPTLLNRTGEILSLSLSQSTHLSTAVSVCIIDVEFDFLVIVTLDQGVEIVISSHHHLRAQDVVGVWDETSLSSWGVGMDLLMYRPRGGEVIYPHYVHTDIILAATYV